MTTIVSTPIQLPAEQRAGAEKLSRGLTELSWTSSRALALLLPSGEQLTVPESLIPVFREVAEALARGDAVSIVPLHRELTTQEAADLLNVSRQHLVDLLESGAIPYRRLHKHRRIRADELLAYKSRRDTERRDILRELTQESQEAGGYFEE